jgi:hypothetical protein
MLTYVFRALQRGNRSVCHGGGEIPVLFLNYIARSIDSRQVRLSVRSGNNLAAWIQIDQVAKRLRTPGSVHWISLAEARKIPLAMMEVSFWARSR